MFLSGTIVTAFLGMFAGWVSEGLAREKAHPTRLYMSGKKCVSELCEHCDYPTGLISRVGITGWVLSEGRCGHCKLRLPFRFSWRESAGLVVGLITGVVSQTAEAWITGMVLSLYSLYSAGLNGHRSEDESHKLTALMWCGIMVHLLTGKLVTVEESICGGTIIWFALQILRNVMPATNIWLNNNTLLYCSSAGVWLGITWASGMLMFVLCLIVSVACITRSETEIRRFMGLIPLSGVVVCMLMLSQAG